MADDNTDGSFEEIQEDVLSYVKENDGVSTQDIATEFSNRDTSVLTGCIGQLSAEDEISSDKEGRWYEGSKAPTEKEPWEETPVANTAPKENDLNERERFILSKLQEGATLDKLADELETKNSIINTHISDLRSQGWKIYRDETSELVTLQGDHAIRSSEHKGARTRKANRWWEKRHSKLVQDFKSLTIPTIDIGSNEGNEDWVHVVSDVHAGDKVKTPDRTNVYGSDTIPRILDYDTEKSLELAEYHGANYDVAHLCYLGDMVTNEGIYEGQFEDLDAWLDEQHNMMMEPLLKQIKAYSDRFEKVNVICQVGNHGNSRASGTSQQANADLILYKSIRNAIATSLEYGGDTFSNVSFTIGQARPYTNFKLRGDSLIGHLRHGDNRPPQAVTRMGSDKWNATLLSHDFDLACIGHHHISGRVPWSGPPIFVNGTMKPPSDFVDKIAADVSLDPRERVREISTCFSVADHGITGTYPVKTHDFDYVSSD